MDVKTAVFIHEFLVDYFANTNDPVSPPGIKNQNSLESAVARKDATFGVEDVYQTVFEKTAALFHSLIGNHPFHNGNKRTALLSVLYYLSEHNYSLDTCPDDDMYEFTRKVAAHEITNNIGDEVTIIAEWFGKNARKQTKAEKPMKRDELHHALSNFGYNLVDNGHNIKVIDETGNVIEIVLKREEGKHSDYDAKDIAELRKNLHLTPKYRVDSAQFYGPKSITEDLDKLMLARVEVMKRLAKI